jgi:hypothetical protein
MMNLLTVVVWVVVKRKQLGGRDFEIVRHIKQRAHE